MARKTTPTKAQAVITPIVQFKLDNRTYQIDPGRQKVYRSFVEIETSKAAEIYSRWRSKTARA